LICDLAGLRSNVSYIADPHIGKIIMDIQTIDNQYRQMQDQSQKTVQELRSLATKLQGAAQAGNQDAREWLLDLKSIALAIQSEQNQVANLLQALHNFMESQNQNQMPQQ